MLAHKTLNSKESRAASKSATSSDTYLLDYANVRIWKPGFFPQSTIPLAEEMRDGPHGGLRLDETDTGDVDILNSNYVGLHEAEAKLDSKLHISSNKKSNEKVEKEKESDNSPTVNVNVRDILTITWKVMYLIDSNATVINLPYFTPCSSISYYIILLLLLLLLLFLLASCYCKYVSSVCSLCSTKNRLQCKYCIILSNYFLEWMWTS
jgi:hypothetical protein